MTKNDRWWESYLVRYLAGNIFAVLVLFYLVIFYGNDIQKSLCSVNSDKTIKICGYYPKETDHKETFSEQVFGFIFVTGEDIESNNVDKAYANGKDFKSDKSYKNHKIGITEINFANVFVLGVFGFLYMYISSIPIYFIHITRGALPSGFLKPLIFVFLCFITWYLIDNLCSICVEIKIKFLMWIYAITTEAICLLFFSAILSNIHIYLKKSAFKRDMILNNLNVSGKGEIIQNSKECYSNSEFSSEYITSYKHMREHGNAFSVILMEILFAWLLIRFDFSLLFFVSWLAVGAFGWFLGSYLEFKMVDSSE
jgi:hypothetical protein